MAGVSPGREWPAGRRGVAPGLYSIRYSIRRRRVNPLRNLRFRPVTNRWASRVRLGLPARWAGLLSCRSEVTPFRIHQPEHDGPRGFGVIVHNPRKNRPALRSSTGGLEVLFAFPGGALSRRPPSTGSGTRTRTPPWRTRDFKSLASAVSPSRHSTRPSSPLRRSPAPGLFPGRRRDRSEHSAERSKGITGRNCRARTREFPKCGSAPRTVGPDERRPDAVSGGSGGAPAAQTGNGMSRTSGSGG